MELIGVFVVMVILTAVNYNFMRLCARSLRRMSETEAHIMKLTDMVLKTQNPPQAGAQGGGG